MAKRTVQRLLALALAGSMSMSVLATAAMAVDYDAANGTVIVESGDSGVQSWQDEANKSSDTTINISGTTNQQVVNVGEGVGSDVTINIDNVNADVTDTSAVEANGGTVNIEGSSLSGGTEGEAAVVVGGNANVNIEDSTITGNSEDKAAVEVGGDANVNISGETEIIGSGTGLEVNGGSVTIESGADVEIVGNKVEANGIGGETSVTVDGTGMDINGGSVTVESGANVEIIGSDVTVSGEAGEIILKGDEPVWAGGVVSATPNELPVTGSNTGVDISDGSLIVKGTADIHGQKVTASDSNRANVAVDTTGNTGIAASGGNVIVAEGGQLITSDLVGTDKSNPNGKRVPVFVEDPTGSYDSKRSYVYYYNTVDQKYEYKKPSGQMLYDHDNDGVKEQCYKVMMKGGNPAKYAYLPVDGTPLYNQITVSVKGCLTANAEGTGLGLSSDTKLDVSGSLLATGSKTGIAMADSVKVTVGPDGKLVTNYISKNGGTIDNAGLVFVQEAAEGLREAINNSGTGLRFVSFEQVPKTGEGVNYENILHLYWEAGKDESAQELLVPLKEMVVAAWNALYCVQEKQFAGTVVEPGDHMNFDIVITNKSGYTYSYKANSLVVGVGAEALQAFENAAKDAIEDGKVSFLCSRVPNRAIQDLYGKSHSSELTLNELLNVETKLKTDGFDGQTFDSLEAYYLYYINKQAAAQTPAGETPKQYEKLEEVPFNLFENILPVSDNTSFANGIFQLSFEDYFQLIRDIKAGKYPDGKYKVTSAYDRKTGMYNVQIKETDCVKMQAVYQYMYCLAYGFGEFVDQDIANLKEPPYSTYLDNPLDYIDKDVWQKANNYFAGQIGKDGLTTGKSTNAQVYLLIDGVLTSNFLQNTQYSLENYIVLNRVDPEKPPVTPEEPGTPPPNTPDDRLRGGYGSFALADNFVNEITIEDEDVPLADVPKTGDVSMLWLVLSGLCGAAMLLGMKRRRTTQA